MDRSYPPVSSLCLSLVAHTRVSLLLCSLSIVYIYIPLPSLSELYRVG